MRKQLIHLLQVLVVLTGLSGFASANAVEVHCKLGFSLSGWSEKNQTGTGSGTIRCSDNESMHVKIRINGHGIANGMAKIASGRGEFTKVSRVDHLLGTYVSGEAAGGDATAAHAQVLSKGTLRLTLDGSEGWERGIKFTSFKLSARRSKPT
jgi:hypothetical protein